MPSPPTRCRTATASEIHTRPEGRGGVKSSGVFERNPTGEANSCFPEIDLRVVEGTAHMGSKPIDRCRRPLPPGSRLLRRLVRYEQQARADGKLSMRVPNL